jgi:hypothetical protein
MENPAGFIRATGDIAAEHFVRPQNIKARAQ